MTTIRCLLEESAYISKHEAGIIQGGKIILFSDWNNLASGVAARLLDEGVQRGDRVSVFMANDWRMLVILLGILRAGAVACPLSTRLPRQAVTERLAQIDSRWLVAYLAGDNPESLGAVHVIAPDALISTTPQAAPPVKPYDVDQPAMIVFTSGSTAEPRPAVLSYGNLYYNARGANVNLRLRSKDRWLLNLPMYHVGGIGIIFRCLLSGAAVMIPEMREKLIDSIIQYKPSCVSVVPTQLSGLVDDPDAGRLKSVRCFLVGGDAVSTSLLEHCRERKWPVMPTYGMTEMGSQITAASENALDRQPSGTSGTVLRHRELCIDETGEILVRGDCLFLGYWNDGCVKRPLDDDGWFHTGDLGVLSDDGRLRVTGRKDYRFISGGENIQPEEIERHLEAIEGIEKAVVVPVRDEKYGARPFAFVKSSMLTPTGWCASLSATLPGFMIPDHFAAWPDSATEADLKVSRSLFAELAAKHLRRE